MSHQQSPTSPPGLGHCGAEGLFLHEIHAGLEELGLTCPDPCIPSANPGGQAASPGGDNHPPCEQVLYPPGLLFCWKPGLLLPAKTSDES